MITRIHLLAALVLGSAALAVADRDRYGGCEAVRAKAIGFFRTE